MDRRILELTEEFSSILKSKFGATWGHYDCITQGDKEIFGEHICIYIPNEFSLTSKQKKSVLSLVNTYFADAAIIKDDGLSNLGHSYLIILTK